MPKLSTHSSTTTSSRQTDTGRTKNKSCRRTTQRSNKHVNYNITIASPSTIDLSHKYRHIPHQNVERKDFLDTYYLHLKASEPVGFITIAFFSKLAFFYLIWSIQRNFHISRHFSLYIVMLQRRQKDPFYAKKRGKNITLLFCLTTIGHR